MRREELRTPCYIIQEKKIRENLERLKRICDETGCRILLAQKAFSMYSLYPLIGEYLSGATARITFFLLRTGRTRWMRS